MPESESFITSLSDPALNDPAAVKNISIVAGHLYGASPSFYTNAENKGKEVWETEHFLTPAGAQPAIGDAIAAAQEIHNSLTVGPTTLTCGGGWRIGIRAAGSPTPAWWTPTTLRPTSVTRWRSSRNLCGRDRCESALRRARRQAYLSRLTKAVPTAPLWRSTRTLATVSLPVTLKNLSVGSVTPYRNHFRGRLGATERRPGYERVLHLHASRAEHRYIRGIRHRVDGDGLRCRPCGSRRGHSHGRILQQRQSELDALLLRRRTAPSAPTMSFAARRAALRRLSSNQVASVTSATRFQ